MAPPEDQRQVSPEREDDTRIQSKDETYGEESDSHDSFLWKPHSYLLQKNNISAILILVIIGGSFISHLKRFQSWLVSMNFMTTVTRY